MQLAASQQACQEGDVLIQSLRAHEVCSGALNVALIRAPLDSCLLANSIARLKEIVQELGNELAKSQRVANEQKDSLNDITKSLRSDLRTQDTNSSMSITLACFANIHVS